MPVRRRGVPIRGFIIPRLGVPRGRPLIRGMRVGGRGIPIGRFRIPRGRRAAPVDRRGIPMGGRVIRRRIPICGRRTVAVARRRIPIRRRRTVVVAVARRGWPDVLIAKPMIAVRPDKPSWRGRIDLAYSDAVWSPARLVRFPRVKLRLVGLGVCITAVSDGHPRNEPGESAGRRSREGGRQCVFHVKTSGPSTSFPGIWASASKSEIPRRTRSSVGIAGCGAIAVIPALTGRAQGLEKLTPPRAPLLGVELATVVAFA